MTASTMPDATTYAQLIDRIIADGIAEVSTTYSDPKEHYKRDGAIAGFEACRGKTTTDLVALWMEAERVSLQLLNLHVAAARLRQEPSAESYWKQRYKSLQIEFVCNVVSVGLVNNGQPPLLGHLPTARGAMKYAAIVGVREVPIS